MDRLLKRYPHLILDWESDGAGYFVYLRKPYVVDVSGQITDMISEDTIREVEYRLKRVFKIDPAEWDNL
jgi:hypothetical protein